MTHPVPISSAAMKRQLQTQSQFSGSGSSAAHSSTSGSHSTRASSSDSRSHGSTRSSHPSISASSLLDSSGNSGNSSDDGGNVSSSSGKDSPPMQVGTPYSKTLDMDPYEYPYPEHPQQTHPYSSYPHHHPHAGRPPLAHNTPKENKAAMRTRGLGLSLSSSAAAYGLGPALSPSMARANQEAAGYMMRGSNPGSGASPYGDYPTSPVVRSMGGMNSERRKSQSNPMNNKLTSLSGRR